MTIERYTEITNSLFERFQNARKNKCNRTALARLRDIAKAKAEYTSRDYKDVLDELLYTYKVNA